MIKRPFRDLGTTAAMLYAMIRPVTARTNGRVFFPICTGLVLDDAIRHTSLWRLNSWDRISQLNASLLASSQVRSTDIAYITQLFSC
jgi:hypothetical protein